MIRQPSRQHKPCSKAEIGITPIIYAVIGIIVLTVVVIILIQKGAGPAQDVGSKLTYSQKKAFCNQQYKEDPACQPRSKDKDGDCLPDSCDYCINPALTKPAMTAPKDKQRAGSNLFDNDNDGLPDLCDAKPKDPSSSSCTWEGPGRQRCKIPTTYTIDGKKGGIEGLSRLNTPEDTVESYALA